MKLKFKLKKEHKSRIFQKKIDLVIALLALAVGLYFRWMIFDILVFVVFIWTFMNPVKSKYPAMVALLLLALTPFMLIAKREDIAEQISIYAYYFLIITVIMGIYEIRQEGKEQAPESR